MLENLTELLLPALLLLAGAAGIAKKQDVYDGMLAGAQDGLRLMFSLIPTLILMLTAVTMLRRSGFFELLTPVFAPVFRLLGMPPEVAPLVLIRPLSGSAALAVGTDLMREYGVDSVIGRTAAVMLGSSETTFYTISVYFGSAGIRDTQDVIEKIGVDRSMEAAKDCDVALYVLDDSKPMTEEDRRAMGAALEAPEAVAILNKQDLAAVIEPSDLPFAYIVPISCKDGTGFDLLEQAFDMLFPDDTPCDGSLLTNARQAGAILRAKKSVDSAVQSLRAGMTPDAVLVDLESAMDALGEVTGRTMREDITNRIFERFCVGK